MLFGDTIKDPMFGELELNRGGTERFWRGRVVFAPTNDLVRVIFWHLEDSIPNIQKDFYRELENRYFEMTHDIGEHIRTAYLRSKGPLPNEDIWKVFKLVEFTFPSASGLSKGLFEWDMYFSYDSQKPNFLVEMKNWSPEECYSGE